MPSRSIRYQAYLVRFWAEGAPQVWRASAQHVQSGETVRFAEVTQLFAFLQAQLDDPPEPARTISNDAATAPPR